MHNFLCTLWLISLSYSCNQQSENKRQEKVTVATSIPIACSNEVSDKSWYTEGRKAPLFKGLEGIHLPVSTKNLEVQKYFDQGLMLSFAFNHAEAGRSFYEAARLDSNCAMCWWGFAYVLGPNYNAGMEKD